MSKIEQSKILHYSFDSKARGVGTYKKDFKILRRRPSLDTAFITTKAALTGGLTPLTRGEMLLVDAIATLNVYLIPIDKNGRDLPEDHPERDGWVDDILDQAIIFDLHAKWIDYQNSFYPEAEVSDGPEAETAAEPQAPVQGQP